MGRVRLVGGTLAVILSMLLLPASASAQATTASGIAGVARDTSGAVLPGVTVEASSPALIEKVRSAVTDGEGRYNIIDLRSGDYVRDLHASWLQDVQARRHRPAGGVHRDR